MQNDRHDDASSSERKPKGEARRTGNASPTGGDPSFSEMEQPGRGHPAPGTGLPQASEQAGEGNPDPTSRDPGQRVQKPEDDESEAVLQDGKGAGRPGRGIYSGP